MLTKIEVRNNQGALLILPLEDISDGLVLEDVEGLDPVKATIVSSKFAQQDGSQFHSTRREERNILIKLGLEPDYISNTVRDLRKRLYNFFMPESEVNLRFYMADGLEVDILGRVESCEAPLFTKEPEMDISIICFDPDFIELESVVIIGTTTSSSTETVITYDGTVKTGIQLVLNVDRSITEFTIYHRPPDGVLRTMDFAASLIDGDVLTISTVTGKKGATLNRGGTISSLLYGVSPQSNQIELDHGENNIRVYAEGAGIPFEITYLNRYGGL